MLYHLPLATLLCPVPQSLAKNFLLDYTTIIIFFLLMKLYKMCPGLITALTYVYYCSVSLDTNEPILNKLFQTLRLLAVNGKRGTER